MAPPPPINQSINLRPPTHSADRLCALVVVPAQIWFAANKFNLTCKGAQFELLADDGYQNVLTMLNSVPYDFNIANGAGDYITPLLAKFLQIAIKVYDVKRCEWMTYFPNMEPADDPARSERETCMARCVRHRVTAISPGAT